MQNGDIHKTHSNINSKNSHCSAKTNIHEGISHSGNGIKLIIRPVG